MNRNSKNKSKASTIWLVALLGVSIVVAYFGVGKLGFTNWDDPVYVLEQPMVKEGGASLFKDNVWGNYHPLTMLSLRLDYLLFGEWAAGFHWTNVGIHLINAMLVFFFVKQLTHQNLRVAIFTALLFGVHPMHVESVAWISERKDVLYVMFYLLGMMLWLNYLDKGKNKWLYFLALLVMVLSLLSKAVAVTLPLVFLLIDYYRGRQWHTSLLTEKLPFLALSVLFGIIAINAQQDAIPTNIDFGLGERIIIAGFAYGMYFFKAIVPFSHSAFYPYPEQGIPLWYFGVALSIPIAIFLVVKYWKQHKDLVFGLGMFSIPLVLVLQILPVGGAMMADRYTYLPYIGVGIFLFGLQEKLLSKIPIRQRLFHWSNGMVVLAMLVYLILTIRQVPVWTNSATLWTQVIEQYPNVAIAYGNRGAYYTDQNQPKQALSDLNKAIALQPEYAGAYYNRAKLYHDQQQFKLALQDYHQTIELDSTLINAYYNRGVLLQELQSYELAIRDYEKVIKNFSSHVEAMNNIGIIYRKQSKFEEALFYFNKAMKARPEYAGTYINRGNLFLSQQQFDKAIQDYNKAVALDPSNGSTYFNRSQAWYAKGDFEKARSDAASAEKAGFKVDNNYWQVIKNSRN